MRFVRSTMMLLASALLLCGVLIAPTTANAVATGTLVVLPGQSIKAQFSGTRLDKKRAVALQQSGDGLKWATVKTVKMSATGLADFAVPATDAGFYRAVAAAFRYKAKSTTVTSAAVTSDVKQLQSPTLDDPFSGTQLAPMWNNRDQVGYQASGRWCSAPFSGNVTVAGGAAALSMTATPAGEAATVIADAKRRQQEANPSGVAGADAAVAAATSRLAAAQALPRRTASQRKARTKAISQAKSALTKARAARAALTPGCPTGVYRNAMVTTRGAGVPTSAGTVVAKVKFPIGQGGHGGIWLQAPNGQEIDIIEAYGYGRGITNIIHRLNGTELVKDPALAAQAYVAVKPTRSKAWWSKWHTVAVTFNERSITFFLDGVKTRQLVGMPAADYDLMMSLLSSDWETYRVKKPDVRPGSGVSKKTVKKQSLPTMRVDWIRIWAA
jgi:hypothetical protein